MRIENKDFWEQESIIATQEVLKDAADFELFMFEKAAERYQSIGEIKVVKIFGCGTGRETKAIADFYKPAKMVVSDIAENMILKCIENLKLWKLDSITATVVGDAKEYNKVSATFDLVTLLNSMMTYVPLRKDRLTIFRNAYQILKPSAVIIGTVHNQVGTPAKTMYFKIKSLFSFILTEKVGNRTTGFNGFKVPGYYYDKKTLINDLLSSGFKNVEVYSLEEFYHLNDTIYNRKKGYNNLLFIASKS